MSAQIQKGFENSPEPERSSSSKTDNQKMCIWQSGLSLDKYISQRWFLNAFFFFPHSEIVSMSVWVKEFHVESVTFLSHLFLGRGLGTQLIIHGKFSCLFQSFILIYVCMYVKFRAVFSRTSIFNSTSSVARRTTAVFSFEAADYI